MIYDLRFQNLHLPFRPNGELGDSKGCFADRPDGNKIAKSQNTSSIMITNHKCKQIKLASTILQYQ